MKVLVGAFNQEKALVRVFSMTVKIQSLRRFVWSSSDDTAGSRAQPIPSQLYQTSNDYYYTTITRYTTLQTKMFHVEHKTVNWKTSCPCRPSSYDLGTVNVLLDQIRILKWRVKMSMNLELHLFLKNCTTNCIQQWPPSWLLDKIQRNARTRRVTRNIYNP